MIFRLTTKLGKKIGILPSLSLPSDENPFADWSAHLFTAKRVQYILITNTPSLYSILIYGKGITNESKFLRRVMSYMSEFMRDDGLEFIYRRLVAPETAHVSFSKALNRSVTGSMNDLVLHAKFFLIEFEMSPYDVSLRLNEIPMTLLKYNHPREAFKSLQR